MPNRLKIALVLAVALLPLAPRLAQAGERGKVTVIGEGTVSVRPDVAQLNVGVVVTAATVKEAMQQNRVRMEKVLAALEGLGISQKDIATSNFSIRLDQPRPDRGEKEAEERYHVSNMVRVRVRDLEKIDTVLEVVADAGANQMWGVQMVIDDPESAAVEARRLAAEQARSKAGELAALHGRKLGDLVELIEMGDGPVGKVMALERAGGGSIRPGELEVTARLQATYEIE